MHQHNYIIYTVIKSLASPQNNVTSLHRKVLHKSLTHMHVHIPSSDFKQCAQILHHTIIDMNFGPQYQKLPVLNLAVVMVLILAPYACRQDYCGRILAFILVSISADGVVGDDGVISIHLIILQY